MGDVDDVEHAEGDRHADRHGGVEAAEQNARHHRAQQQIKRDGHGRGSISVALGRQCLAAS
jgi:hypothetical protein